MTPDADYVARTLAQQGDRNVDGAAHRNSAARGSSTLLHPGLQPQVENLRSRRLSEFSVATTAIRLSFWGEAADPVDREIRIEHASIGLAVGDQPEASNYAWDDPAIAGTLLTCLNQPLTSISIASGRLTIEFANATRIQVEPDQEYESWQISGEDGLLVVCTPGGDLSVQCPTERWVLRTRGWQPVSRLPPG
jgi:hypothetical protein